MPDIWTVIIHTHERHLRETGATEESLRKECREEIIISRVSWTIFFLGCTVLGYLAGSIHGAVAGAVIGAIMGLFCYAHTKSDAKKWLEIDLKILRELIH